MDGGVGNGQLSALERLPPELRNRIYSLTVLKGHVLKLESALSQPALAATNSNIRREVLPIFFGKSTFLVNDYDVFGPFDSFKIFLNSIDKYTPLMRSVGAYDTAPPTHFGYEKIYVRISDDLSVRVRFRDLSRSLPACLCEIQKIVQEERGDGYAETLPRRLIVAAAYDINRSMDKVETWKGSPKALAGVKSAGCKECKEFRKSARYL